MSRKATWKVIQWDKRPELVHELECTCPDCGHEAYLPVGSFPNPIASIGIGFVFNPEDYPPPEGWSPQEVQCRHCRRYFEHVR